MIVSEARGTPIATASASPNEVTLVDASLAERLVGALPQRMLGDGAYLSDRGCEVIGWE